MVLFSLLIMYFKVRLLMKEIWNLTEYKCVMYLSYLFIGFRNNEHLIQTISTHNDSPDIFFHRRLRCSYFRSHTQLDSNFINAYNVHLISVSIMQCGGCNLCDKYGSRFDVTIYCVILKQNAIVRSFFSLFGCT